MTQPLEEHSSKLAELLDAFLALNDPAAAHGVVRRLLDELPRWDPEAPVRILAAIGGLEKSARWRRGKSLSDLAADALTSNQGDLRGSADLLRSLLVGTWAALPATERVLGFDHHCLDSTQPEAQQSDPETLLLDRDHREKTDVVIVGSGAGGGAAAAALSALGFQVIILEAGLPHGQQDTAGSPLERQRRFADPFKVTSGMAVRLLAGQGIGGSTRAWYGTIERPSPEQVQKWSDLWERDPDWFQRRSEQLESRLNVQAIPDSLFGHNANAVGSGAVQTGATVRALRRSAPGCRGCGTCLGGCPIGALKGSGNLLADATRNGATLIGDARAHSIIIENGQATGVIAFTRAGHQVRIDADTVLLATGALNTPALLQRNALGSRSGKLGSGVSIRPSVWVSGSFDGSLRGWTGVPQTLAISAPANVSLRATAHPPSIMATLLPGIGIGARRAILEAEQLAGVSVTVLDRDGTIDGERVSFTPSAETLIALRSGIAAAAAILFEAGAIHVHAGIDSLAPVRDQIQLQEALAGLDERTPVRLVAHDTTGGCPVGFDPADNVLDPTGRVHGVAGLYVADGSALPDPPEGAPGLSVMLHAVRIAELLGSGAR